jgi:hypothetical protein
MAHAPHSLGDDQGRIVSEGTWRVSYWHTRPGSRNRATFCRRYGISNFLQHGQIVALLMRFFQGHVTRNADSWVSGSNGMWQAKHISGLTQRQIL